MLSRLFLVAVLLAGTQCSLFDEGQELVALEDYNDLTCLQEMSELYLEDFFMEHPTLKPSVRANVIELKRSFVKFMDMMPDEQEELIDGAPTPHKVLAHFLKRFVTIAREEWKRLSYADRRFAEDLEYYAYHKLLLRPQVKYVGQKKAEFLASGLSRKEFTENLMNNCGKISHGWNMDPGYAMSEEAFKNPEFAAQFEEAMRKFEANKGSGEMLTIHMDGQTGQNTINTVKINRDL